MSNTIPFLVPPEPVQSVLERMITIITNVVSNQFMFLHVEFFILLLAIGIVGYMVYQKRG